MHDPAVQKHRCDEAAVLGTLCDEGRHQAPGEIELCQGAFIREQPKVRDENQHIGRDQPKGHIGRAA